MEWRGSRKCKESLVFDMNMNVVSEKSDWNEGYCRVDGRLQHNWENAALGQLNALKKKLCPGIVLLFTETGPC